MGRHCIFTDVIRLKKVLSSNELFNKEKYLCSRRKLETLLCKDPFNVEANKLLDNIHNNIKSHGITRTTRGEPLGNRTPWWMPYYKPNKK